MVNCLFQFTETSLSSSLSSFWTGPKCNRINDQLQSKISAKQPTRDQQQSISAEIITQKCKKKNYATVLYYGYGIPENKKESLIYYKFSSDKGDIESTFMYGAILYLGDGIPPNKSESSVYFKQAADQGHIESIVKYALWRWWKWNYQERIISLFQTSSWSSDFIKI